jgi:hypothetical protein
MAVVGSVVALHSRFPSTIITAHFVKKAEDSGAFLHLGPNLKGIGDSGAVIVCNNLFQKPIHASSPKNG